MIGSTLKFDFGSSEYIIISYPAIRLVITSKISTKQKEISKRALDIRYASKFASDTFWSAVSLTYFTMMYSLIVATMTIKTNMIMLNK